MHAPPRVRTRLASVGKEPTPRGEVGPETRSKQPKTGTCPKPERRTDGFLLRPSPIPSQKFARRATFQRRRTVRTDCGSMPCAMFIKMTAPRPAAGGTWLRETSSFAMKSSIDIEDPSVLAARDTQRRIIVAMGRTPRHPSAAARLDAFKLRYEIIDRHRDSITYLATPPTSLSVSTFSRRSSTR